MANSKVDLTQTIFSFKKSLLHHKFYENVIVGPKLPLNCTDGSMVSSSNGREAVLVGCNENPEKIFKLRWSNETTLEWVLMKQKLKYPRSNAVTMLIPDSLLTHCYDSEIRGISTK